MEENVYLDLLKKREIQPTAIRILVRNIVDLSTVSSIYSRSSNETERLACIMAFSTITLFLSHHLIHCIDDGTKSFKYAVCSDSCACEMNDLHTHFHCEKCNKTFCFKNIPTPVVNLPQGFTLSSINYVLKGVCPDCAEHL